jgi:hypothetical protein
VFARPVLYLDVDGVLNVLQTSSRHWDDLQAYDVTLHGRTYRLHLSRHMGQALAALPVDIRWATTWAEAADERIAPLVGLPAGLPIACRPPVSSSPFKSAAIRRQVAVEGRPFVWVDDEAIADDDIVWAERLATPSLLVRPDPTEGVTPEQIITITEFVESLIKGAS